MVLKDIIICEDIIEGKDGATLVASPQAAFLVKYLPTTHSFASTILVLGAPEREGILKLEIFDKSNLSEAKVTIEGPLNIGTVPSHELKYQQLIINTRFNNVEFTMEESQIFKVYFDGEIIGEKEVDVILIGKNK